MPPPTQSRHLPGRVAPAFTLVETLAVIALVALAVMFGAVHLSGATRRARLDAALHVLAQADAMARTRALSGEPTVLCIESEGVEVVVLERRSGMDASRQRLPSGFLAGYSSLDGHRLPCLEFDAEARCADHERVLTTGGRVAAAVRVSGVTGWSEPVGGAP
jgi:type II secretory pathway pseudopilin PulG